MSAVLEAVFCKNCDARLTPERAARSGYCTSRCRVQFADWRRRERNKAAAPLVERVAKKPGPPVRGRPTIYQPGARIGGSLIVARSTGRRASVDFRCACGREFTKTLPTLLRRMSFRLPVECEPCSLIRRLAALGVKVTVTP